MKVWKVRFNVHHVHPGASKRGGRHLLLPYENVAPVRKKIAPEPFYFGRELFSLMR